MFLPEVRGLWKALCQFSPALQMFRIQWAHCFPYPASCLPSFTTKLLSPLLPPSATLAQDSAKQSCGDTTSLFTPGFSSQSLISSMDSFLCEVIQIQQSQALLFLFLLASLFCFVHFFTYTYLLSIVAPATCQSLGSASPFRHCVVPAQVSKLFFWKRTREYIF